MDQAKVNQHFATGFADQLARSGVMEVCLAPGSRSAPLAMAFARHHGLRTRVLIDERSCSFFAVGLAKAGDSDLTASGDLLMTFIPLDEAVKVLQVASVEAVPTPMV